VIGGTVAWHAEIDPGACRVLAHRYPDVPNLGDVERVGLPFSDEEWEEIKSAQKFHGVEYEMPAPDWSGVDPVDVLTGGFPCTDVSAAGKREGIRPGTRSGLWGRFLDAIEQLHPSLVVIENVRGLLSADAHHPAHSELEPCPWDMGDGSGPTLRALGAVLGDLADIGFDAEWVGLRAADAGAPHGRFRVFIVAWPAAGAGRLGHGEPARAREDPRAVGALAWGEAVGTPPAHPDGDALREQPVPIAGGSGPALAGPASADAAPHPAGDRRDERRTEPARLLGGPDAALSGDAAADPSSAERRGAESDDLGTRPQRAAELGERPGFRSAVKASGGYGPAFRRWAARAAAVDRGGLDPVPPSPADCTCPQLWGQYAPAVHRWETILGRLAPPPTELSARGAPRLSPRAVEFLMGLPAGWVTDVPGLGRNEMLRALGNGVVPAQCAAALRLLLPGVAAAPAGVGGAA
jgi:DNA (cytosine-5)-methyltransferase 1